MRLVVDFEQPRNLYTKVMSQKDRERLVHNIAVHFGNVQSAEIKARQRTSSLLFPITHLC
jgi:catalase